MSGAAAVEPANDEITRRHLEELVAFGLIGSSAIQASAIAQVWGEWARVLTVVAVWLAMSATNWSITAFAFPRYGSERAEDLRVIPNAVFIAIVGHATRWSVSALLFLPFAAVLVGGLQTHRPTGRLVFVAASVGGYALLDHASPVLVTSFTGVAFFWHFVGRAHTRLARVMLAERERHLNDLALAHETLKVAQQSATASAKLASIGVLAAGVAHEINNPMCFVTAHVRALIEDLGEEAQLSPALEEYRDDILPATLDGIRRVNEIVADLRRFARGEPEQSVAFDLATEVEAAVRISRSQLDADQSLRVETHATPPVWGMPRQIGQVALNLIINAIQASGRTGAIVVSVGSANGQAVFAVRDDGPGMTASVLSQLFVPFFTTKDVGEGTGLGLAVAHGIITAHGGRIHVSSAVGRGTTFEVFLPVASQAQRAA